MTLSQEDDALVQGLLDGSLEPAAREAAERLLASSADARRRASELGDLARLLDSLGPAEPPVDLAAQVMHQISGIDSMAAATPARVGAASFGERLSQLFDGGFGMGRKLMWGVVAVAAVALAALKVIGPPALDGTQGTIGAAKRYQAPQIGEADVKVDDSAAAFLQTDTFDQLMKDPDARQLLASPGFRGALAAAEFRQALASPGFARALASPELVKALASPELRQALASPGFAKALAGPEFAKAMAEPGFAMALASPGFARALASPDFAKALASPGFAKALASPAFAKALASPGFAQALASPQMAQALGAVSQ